jgi:hypothetical protein
VETGHLFAAAEASLLHTATVCHVSLLATSATRGMTSKGTIVRTRLYIEVKLWACIPEVLVSNLDWDARYTDLDFQWFFFVPPKIIETVHRVDHVNCLSSPFQFIIYV